MNQKLIQAVHIYILLIISTGFMVHVLLLPIILSSSGRDAWLSVLFSIIPVFIWVLFVFYLYKKLKNNDILTLLKKSTNKWIPPVISAIFTVYFFLTALITLKYTVFWAKANYTFDVPNLVVILAFTIIAYYASYKGIRTISSIAFLILPLIVLFGFLVGIGNIPSKNYELLFPIFEKGYKDFFQGFIYTCSGYFEMIFILFLTSYLKDSLKMKWLIFVGFVFVLLTFGPLVGAISEFGSVEATKMRNPAYEQWKQLRIGHNLTRLDFLSIFQWISGAFIRMSLSFFISEKLISNKKKKKWALPALYVLLVIAAWIPWGATSFFYFLKNIYFPINCLFLICTMLLLLLFLRIKGDNL